MERRLKSNLQAECHAVKQRIHVRAHKDSGAATKNRGMGDVAKLRFALSIICAREQDTPARNESMEAFGHGFLFNSHSVTKHVKH
jgi:hypothetical protein